MSIGGFLEQWRSLKKKVVKAGHTRIECPPPPVIVTILKNPLLGQVLVKKSLVIKYIVHKGSIDQINY